MRYFFLGLLLIFGLQAKAQRADSVAINLADTVVKDIVDIPDTVAQLHSRTWTLIPPAVLMGYGAISFFVHPIRQFDYTVFDKTNHHVLITKYPTENFIQYAPIAFTYGLNMVGVHGKNTFVDRTILLGLSQAISNTILYTVKHTSHRLRPNEGNYYSFPSGHTTFAFTNAEFMSQELSGKSPLYGVLGYALATTTGIFRIYHQDHWFSDVVAGAGLGIISTKTAYLLYPILRNRLTRAGREKEREKKLNETGFIRQKPKKEKMLLPSFESGALGLAFSMEL